MYMQPNRTIFYSLYRQVVKFWFQISIYFLVFQFARSELISFLFQLVSFFTVKIIHKEGPRGIQMMKYMSNFVCYRKPKIIDPFVTCRINDYRITARKECSTIQIGFLEVR